MKKICCICGKEFEEFGNNPWPVKDEGQCCNKCNRTKVIPTRFATLERGEDLSPARREER